MNNVMKYKGYYARIEYSDEDRLLCGKIEDVNDLVNFSGETVDEVENAFHNAVDEYLAFCDSVGKEPERPCSGTFNVRIRPELHRALVRKATLDGSSLNATVEKAISAYLNPPASQVVLVERIPEQETAIQNQVTATWEGLMNVGGKHGARKHLC